MRVVILFTIEANSIKHKTFHGIVTFYYDIASMHDYYTIHDTTKEMGYNKMKVYVLGLQSFIKNPYLAIN